MSSHQISKARASELWGRFEKHLGIALDALREFIEGEGWRALDYSSLDAFLTDHPIEVGGRNGRQIGGYIAAVLLDEGLEPSDVAAKGIAGVAFGRAKGIQENLDAGMDLWKAATTRPASQRPTPAVRADRGDRLVDTVFVSGVPHETYVRWKSLAAKHDRPLDDLAAQFLLEQFEGWLA